MSCLTSSLALPPQEPPAERLDGLNDIFTNNTADMIMDFEVTASVSLLVDTTSQAKGNQTVRNSYCCS